MLEKGSIVAGNETIQRKLLKLLKDASGPGANDPSYPAPLPSEPANSA
jgi:hypothetical protein